MKKITNVTTVFRCLKPYRNWYNIMSQDGFYDINVIIVGKLELLKLIIALIKLLIFNKSTVIKRYRKDE